MYIGVVRSAEQIVQRHIEIIGKHNKGAVIGFTRAVFVAAQSVLVHIQINGKFDLGYFPLFTEFF